MNFIEGEVILIDKPIRWSSFDIVKKVRNIIQKYTGVVAKIGHAGTLDPLADGLMILCTGRKTKELSIFQLEEKEYLATIKLGSTTPSYDLETEIDKTFNINHITEDLIINTLSGFIGIQDQVPPTYSAKKINGQRAYKKARKGIHVEMKHASVEIKEIELISNDLPEIQIRIVCSKGTYIRTLAHDLGIALQSGAHLTGLKRTRIGNFNLKNALTLKSLEDLLKTQNNHQI